MAREPISKPAEKALPATGANPPIKKPRKKRTPAVKPAAAKSGRKVWQHAARLGTEIFALLGVGLVGTIAVLGRAAEWFAGVGLTTHLLPFAATVLTLALAIGAFMRLWLRHRAWLFLRWPMLPALVAAVLAIGTGWFAAQDGFRRDLGNLRLLVGGTEEAERTTLSHQVFAAYRRSDLVQMRRMMERAEGYLPVIREAARESGMDEEVLVGVGAAESSFIPRDSKDGGHGLFQITAPPQAALRFAREQLGVSNLDFYNHRHNAFTAAGTLRHYLAEMHGDLFLGLLAYNIGPQNGGLRSIMQQYGARDFVTIQPYLKDLPRDYPIRVLTASLAYRLWRADRNLPRYEAPGNAALIQSIGVPGLDEQATESSVATLKPRS